jgi:hypothetical protein
MREATVRSENRSTVHLLIALTVVALAIQFLDQSLMSRLATLAVLIGAWCKGISMMRGMKWLEYAAWALFALFVVLKVYPWIESW